MTRWTIALLGLSWAAPGLANPLPDLSETWFSVRLAGRHVGHMLWTRAVDADTVQTRTELKVVLWRADQALQVRADESSRETRAGLPLGFSSAFDSAGSTTRVEGEVAADGEVRVLIEGSGQTETRTLRWPAGAMLAEAQRLALLAQMTRGERERQGQVFDPSSLQMLQVASELVGDTRIELPEGAEQVVHVRQRLGREGSMVQVESWLAPRSGFPRRLRMPALGVHLELLACSRACATAVAELTDVFENTVVASPRALSIRDRGRDLDVQLSVRNGPIDALDDVPGQTIVRRDPGGALVRIAATGGDQMAPRPDDLAAARWLQSDHADIRALALNLGGKRGDDRQRMRRLEQGVREFISNKSLRIGYASALEVLSLREGDCTEHAVLLAALARASGIPARVVTGIAYTPRFADRQDVFVPHAWVIAWIDERWQGFDAALPRFDSAHIGLTSGHGDPFDFYSGVELLGNLAIESVERAGRSARGVP